MASRSGILTGADGFFEAAFFEFSVFFAGAAVFSSDVVSSFFLLICGMARTVCTGGRPADSPAAEGSLRSGIAPAWAFSILA